MIATDIVPSAVIPAKSKRYYSRVITPVTEPTDVILPYRTQTIPLEDLEAKLAAQFGDKLQPRRFKNDLPPQPVEKEYPRQNPPPAAWKPERAKMQLEHLTAVRLQELKGQGKRFPDIARMYNTTETAVRAKASEWGMIGKRKANG